MPIVWQIILPILTAALGSVTTFLLPIFFKNISYEQKLSRLIKIKNLINFENCDINRLKEIWLQKIEDYIKSNKDLRRDEFRDLKNIILKLFIYLKYGDLYYKKINNISFNFSNDNKSLFVSGYQYHLNFDYLPNNSELVKKTKYRKDSILNLKKNLQPFFSYQRYHKINSTTYHNSQENIGYSFIPIDFNTKNKNPFLKFYKSKIEKEEKNCFLKKEYNKIKKELKNKCSDLNIPFSINLPCKVHKNDLWTVSFTFSYKKEDKIFYQYLNNYHEDFKILFTKIQLLNIEQYKKNLNNYYFQNIPFETGLYNLSDSKYILNYADLKKETYSISPTNYKLIYHLEQNINVN